MKLVKLVINELPVIITDCEYSLRKMLIEEIGDGVFLEGEFVDYGEGEVERLLFSSEYMVDCLLDGDDNSNYIGVDCSSEEGKFVDVKLFVVNSIN